MSAAGHQHFRDLRAQLVAALYNALDDEFRPVSDLAARARMSMHKAPSMSYYLGTRSDVETKYIARGFQIKCLYRLKPKAVEANA